MVPVYTAIFYFISFMLIEYWWNWNWEEKFHKSIQHCWFYCRNQVKEKHITHSALLLCMKRMTKGAYVFTTHPPKHMLTC